jgi:ketosteroid isomerase-like protein
MSNAATIHVLYAAFQRRDVPAILDMMADDVRWETWIDNWAQKAGVPWIAPRHGKGDVAAFFALIAQFQIESFSVDFIIGEGDTVASGCTITAAPPGGKRYTDQEIHLWTFDAKGKIIALRHYLDTAKHIDAARSVVKAA